MLSQALISYKELSSRVVLTTIKILRPSLSAYLEFQQTTARPGDEMEINNETEKEKKRK